MTTTGQTKWLVVVDGQPEISVSIDDHAEAYNAANAVATALAKLYVGQQVRVLYPNQQPKAFFVGERVERVEVRRKRIPR